jgi:hypothetical protein
MFQGGTSVWNGGTYGPYSANGETAGSQARLEYYTSDQSRIKVYKTNSGYPAVTDNYGGPYGESYWESSAYISAASFCLVYANGHTGNSTASWVGGCAPAFCVK